MGSPSQFNYLNDKMKFATIFLCTLVLAISVSSYDLTPTQARKMRAQCLNECTADCPKNAINIMEGNCKSICKKRWWNQPLRRSLLQMCHQSSWRTLLRLFRSLLLGERLQKCLLPGRCGTISTLTCVSNE